MQRLDLPGQLLGHRRRGAGRDLAGRVQLGLLQRAELAHRLGQGRRVALELRPAHAGQHRPQRGHERGVGRDVAAARGLAQLVGVQRLLVADVEDVRHPDQLEAALEAGEVGDLLERRQVDLVGRADEREIEEQGRARQADRAALDGGQQIFVGLERPLEQVVELDHPPVGADQLPAVLEQRHALQRGRQRGQGPVRRDLALAGVDRHLRLDGDVAGAVAVRHVEALDRDVAQDLEVVAVVRRQQRLVHRAVLGRELAHAQVVGHHQPGRAGRGRVEQRHPVLERDEQHRVVAQLVADAGVDQVVGQVGERVGRAVGAGPAAEAHPRLARALGGEHPREAVGRALIERRVVLERAADAADERRLGGAVGPVQQHQPVGAAVADEAGQRPVELVLRRLLPVQPALAAHPGAVEQLEPADLAPRVPHHLRAVVLEAVDQVLRRAAHLPRRIGQRELHVLRERQHPAGAGEVVAHGRAERGQGVLHRRSRGIAHRADSVPRTSRPVRPPPADPAAVPARPPRARNDVLVTCPASRRGSAGPQDRR